VVCPEDAVKEGDLALGLLWTPESVTLASVNKVMND